MKFCFHCVKWGIKKVNNEITFMLCIFLHLSFTQWKHDSIVYFANKIIFLLNRNFWKRKYLKVRWVVPIEVLVGVKTNCTRRGDWIVTLVILKIFLQSNKVFNMKKKLCKSNNKSYEKHTQTTKSKHIKHKMFSKA